MLLDRLSRLATAGHVGVPDAELIRRVATADEAAFELLVRRHAAAVWKVCRMVAGDPHAAEDAFQATFLALLRKADSVHTNPVGWLTRVATRAALKARRRPLVLPDGFDTTAPDLPSPDDTGVLLHSELDRLAECYRLPIVLCHLHGLTQAEAAAYLGWPLGTVATRVSRGCEVLRKRLLQRGVAFTLALFGTGAASECVVASAVRLFDPAAVSPTTLQLTTEVLRMLSQSRVRVAVLAVCGLLVIAIGIWPGGSPVAPPAVAAPVPPAVDKEKAMEYELAWSDLFSIHASPQHARAVLKLSADPKAGVTFLKQRLKPVVIDKEKALKLLTDLDSEDAKTWKAAITELDYCDPRLVFDVPTMWAAVKTDAGHGRLFSVLRQTSVQQASLAEFSTQYTFDAPDKKSNQDPFFYFVYRYRPELKQNSEFHGGCHALAANVARDSWTRAEVCVAILENIGTPDAISFLKEIAEGHPDSGVTKQAKGVLERLKKK